MQDIVITEPYRFVPPLDARFWPAVLQLYLPRYLRKRYDIASVECRGVDRFRAAIDAGSGVMLTPNHCRLSDPLVLGTLAREARVNFYAMASWHLFKQSWFATFIIRRMGAFSVYREGMDKAAITTAIDILEHARRPLVIFPEGAISRHNDQLMALMEGPSLIARTAARRRAASGSGNVVVLPIAIRYFFRGDLEASLTRTLTEIETHFSWQPQEDKPLTQRIRQIAEALLSLKEIEYLSTPRQGDLYERVAALLDHLLIPLEQEWSIREPATNVIGRVKNLRTAILPDMVEGDISDAQRERRWKQLADCYLAQQLSLYPRDYVGRENNLPEHVLETVERFEEDLTDTIRVHGPLHVVIRVGEPIDVPTKRDRKAATDPIMTGIETQLTTMLSELAAESTEGV